MGARCQCGASGHQGSERRDTPEYRGGGARRAGSELRPGGRRGTPSLSALPIAHQRASRRGPAAPRRRHGQENSSNLKGSAEGASGTSPGNSDAEADAGTLHLESRSISRRVRLPGQAAAHRPRGARASAWRTVTKWLPEPRSGLGTAWEAEEDPGQPSLESPRGPPRAGTGPGSGVPEAELAPGHPSPPPPW